MNKAFNDVPHRDARFCIMVVELVKTTEDIDVRRRVVSRSSRRGFRYNGCLIDQNMHISGVQCGEHFKLGLRLIWERGTTICLWGFVATRLMMVRVSTAFPIVEGALVAVLPFRVLAS